MTGPVIKPRNCILKIPNAHSRLQTSDKFIHNIDMLIPICLAIISVHKIIPTSAKSCEADLSNRSS